MKPFDLLQDETGGWSSARCLLWLWSLVSLVLIVVDRDLSNAILTYLSSVELALIGWAAGPRIAEYLLPQLGRTADAIGQAKRAKERDPENGWEPTP